MTIVNEKRPSREYSNRFIIPHKKTTFLYKYHTLNENVKYYKYTKARRLYGRETKNKTTDFFFHVEIALMHIS